MGSVVTHLMQELAQALASFMQLGFGITYGAAKHCGNFVVLVTVHIMKEKHGLVALRQLRQGGMKIDAVEETRQAWVGSTDLDSGSLFFVIRPHHFVQGDNGCS